MTNEPTPTLAAIHTAITNHPDFDSATDQFIISNWDGFDIDSEWEGLSAIEIANRFMADIVPEERDYLKSL